MLLRQIERIKRSRLIDRLIVATTCEHSDDRIARLCQDNTVDCFRGAVENVLDRFYQAAKRFAADQVVRFTGDCPLIDPHVIDLVIQFHLKGKFDYTSNALEPTYPDGLDTEIFRFDCLERAWHEASLESDREHVTPFFYRQKERFKIGSFKNRVDLSHLRWTVDEGADFELVTKIYEALYPKQPSFKMEDVLVYLDQYPALKSANTHFRRNEGYSKSLARDRYAKSGNPG